MIDDSLDFLQEEELSEEQIRILNCKLENTFIRGLPKSKTLDLIWQKIQVLIEENGIYPKEIVVVFEQEQDKEYLRRKINENLENKDDARDLEFQPFKEFENKYAPNTSDNKKTAKPMNLRTAKKIVFLIDPSLKIRKNFLQLMQWLFPENGAIFFLWEYENNFLEQFQIHNFFSKGTQIINYLEKGHQKTNIRTRSFIDEIEPLESKTKITKEIITKSYEIPTDEEEIGFENIFLKEKNIEEQPKLFDLKVENTFIRGLERTKTLNLVWKAIKRLIKKNKISAQEILVVLDLEEDEEYLREKIIKNIKNTEIDFEKFETFIKKYSPSPHVHDFLKLRRNRKIVFFINTSRKKVEGFLDLISKLFPKKGANFFFWEYEKGLLKETEIQKRFKNIEIIDYRNKQELETPYSFNQPKEKETKDQGIKKYLPILKELSQQREQGLSYYDFELHVPEKEGKQVLEEVFYQILQKEYELFISWTEIIQLNKNKTKAPEELIDKVSNIVYKNPQTISEIISRVRIGKEVIDWNAVFEDEYTTWDWKLFNQLIGEINPIHEPNPLEKVENFLREKTKFLPTSFFKYHPDIVTPKLINPKLQKPKDTQEFKNLEPKVEVNPLEKYLPILKEFKEHRNRGISYRDFELLVPEGEDQQTLKEVFFQILNQEYEVCISWMKIIKINRDNLPVPPELINKVNCFSYEHAAEISSVLANAKIGKEINNVGVVYSDPNTSKSWLELTKIAPNINPLYVQEEEEIEKINELIKEKSETLDTKFFKYRSGIKIPKLIDIKNPQPQETNQKYDDDEEKNDFKDLLLDQELSEEQTKILNCKLENTFIRGLSKSKTLDLIWQKIQVLIEENGIYPKELLVVLEEKNTGDYLQKKIYQNLEDKDSAKNLDFLSLKSFLEKYAPVALNLEKVINPMALKREKKIIFLLNPSLKIKRNFLALMRKLFPVNGAIFFFWEYEENLLEESQIKLQFPKIQIINHLDSQKQSKSQQSEPLINFQLAKYKEILDEMKHLQDMGLTLKNFEIYVHENEDEEVKRRLFIELLNKDFEFVSHWISIIHMNKEGIAVPSKILNRVSRVFCFHLDKVYEIMQKIKTGKEVTNWEIIVNNRYSWKRFKYFSEKFFDEINIYEDRCAIRKINQNIEERAKIETGMFKYVPSFQAPKFNIIPPQEKLTSQEIKNRLHKYSEIIEWIQKHQQSAENSYRDFLIYAHPTECQKVKENVLIQLLKNELDLFIAWMKLFRKNRKSMNITQNLIRDVKKHYSYFYKKNWIVDQTIDRLKQKRKIASSKFENLLNTELIPHEYEQRWKLFKKIIENIDIYRHLEPIEAINDEIIKFAKSSLNKYFGYQDIIKTPKLFSIAENKFIAPWEEERKRELERIKRIQEEQSQRRTINRTTTTSHTYRVSPTSYQSTTTNNYRTIKKEQPKQQYHHSYYKSSSNLKNSNDSLKIMFIAFGSMMLLIVIALCAALIR